MPDHASVDLGRRTATRSVLAAAAAPLIGPLVPGGTAAAARPHPAVTWDDPPPIRPMNILILGGTSFLGPALVRAAQARGHVLTLFNRGRTRTNLFPDVERLHGDRDPANGDGLDALRGDRRWDAVIDTSGYYPRHVAASADLLAGRTDRYIFISTISVYAAHDTPDADENAALGTMEDETVESMGDRFQNYGPLKVLCEKAVERAHGSHALIIRPGFIVGPEDPTDRFTWWMLRLGEGGTVAVPGGPDDPMQVIDVRDLGRWTILCAERNLGGRFNACGHASPIPLGRMVESASRGIGAPVTPRWIPWATLEAMDEAGTATPAWPLCIPPHGPSAGFHRRSNARAVRAGLTFRPLEETARDTHAWMRSQPEARQSRCRDGAGPTLAAERALLASLEAPAAADGDEVRSPT
ncbi:MAG: hypothetical protein KF817_01375 [Phycisphaeraceae bacterium]|nr:hypothetical protein [Phycisphaeraceae bacterium]